MLKHLPKVISFVGTILMLWLDEWWTRSHPGDGSLTSHPFLIGLIAFFVVLLVASFLIPRSAQRALGLDSNIDADPDGWFDPDDSDPEQQEADRELKRITKMGDDPAAESAWQAWLAAERRREEACFVKRRARAGDSRERMTSYVSAIRGELAFDRSTIDPEDPEDSARAVVRRLEEELAWAEAELERMPNA
ncbi:MAG: hypothetical protein IPJ04_02610 [Candidatus Eisenbacteria bacterium]|nr:hypothetical protein [Candidatus Eisenbacteria bacterium]